jgi:hypothetical protein
MADKPTLADARAWLNVPVASLSDADLQQILDAELAIQARLCRVPTEGTVYPDALSRAVLRRCSRQVAARNVPLGVLGAEGSEFGPMQLQSWDAEISRLEASYRIPVIA